VLVLARLARLSPRQRAVLLHAFAWVVLARIALAIVPLPALCRWLTGCPGAKGCRFSLDEVRWAVLAATRRVPGTHCLARSLACLGLLRGASHRIELRLGVANGPRGMFSAHAWPECDGVPVFANEDTGIYAVLPSAVGAEWRLFAS
jgi:hypothetical protein